MTIQKMEFDGEIAAILHGAVETISVGSLAVARRPEEAVGLPEDFVKSYTGVTCIIEGRYDTPNKETFDRISDILASVANLAVHQAKEPAFNRFSDGENSRYDRYALYLTGNVGAGLLALADNPIGTGLSKLALERTIELCRRQSASSMVNLLPAQFINSGLEGSSLA